MRKEVLLAILIGSLLGATIAFGVWRASLSFNKNQDKPNLPSPTVTVKKDTPVEESLTTELEDGFISSNNKIMVKGKTKAGSIVTVLSPIETIITETTAEGNFETEISLENGVNEINLISFDEQGSESVKTLTVVYSTEFEG